LQKGVSPSFIEKTSEYSADSWNYELVMKGTPQYVDYTKIELANNDFRKKEGIKAIVTVPIKIKNSLIGTINIGSHSTATISETIFPLLEAISNQIGILLDRFIVKAILAQSTIEKEKISSLHDIVYQVDKDTIIRYVSTNIKNVIGYSSSEIIGKSFVDLIHPEDLPMVMESYERVKKRIIEPLEYRLKTKDGSYRYILTISEAHFDKQGHYIGLSGIGVDIHEKKMTQIKLQESEAKFKALANSVGTAIFIIQDDILIWVNPATAMVLEYPEQEIIGKPFWIFVHPDDVEIAKERAKARQKGDDVINRYEARIITKNNTIKWIDFNITTICIMAA
jgi:PAS domain S-box